MPSHYLNHCWNIVNWTLGNKFQWNFNRNSNIFIQENAFENVVCEMASICLGLNVLITFMFSTEIYHEQLLSRFFVYFTVFVEQHWNKLGSNAAHSGIYLYLTGVAVAARRPHLLNIWCEKFRYMNRSAPVNVALDVSGSPITLHWRHN